MMQAMAFLGLVSVPRWNGCAPRGGSAQLKAQLFRRAINEERAIFVPCNVRNNTTHERTSKGAPMSSDVGAKGEIEGKYGRFGRPPKLSTVVMPLDPRIKDLPGAESLHTELCRLVEGSRSGIDFFFYNVGTGIALASSGAATVMAVFEKPSVAAILSAIATFFIAITKILKFGSRWAWSLERISRYSVLIYQLNGAATLASNEDREKVVAEVYKKLEDERLRDNLLPGVSDAVS